MIYVHEVLFIRRGPIEIEWNFLKQVKKRLKKTISSQIKAESIQKLTN